MSDPLPSSEDFDIFCSCDEMEDFIEDSSVEIVGDGAQYELDSDNLRIRSGGTFPTDDFRLFVSSVVPDIFTVEFTVNFVHLPQNFLNLVQDHIFLGVSNEQGASAGLFFSQAGILYTGSVHFDSNNLVPDSVLQPLPNSHLLLSEDEFFSIRIACDFTRSSTYIFITKTSDVGVIGHQLRYVLPAIPSSSSAVLPPDLTTISIRGTAAREIQAFFKCVCLGEGLLIPNLPPRADAGIDQAARTCSIVRLDGSRSFDPEGMAITYSWRLIDAPTGSKYSFESTDGKPLPLPVPTGFTNLFHSNSLGLKDAEDAFVAGDVLTLNGQSFNIVGTGTDGNGFYVEVDGEEIPESLVSQPFEVLRQRALNGRTNDRVTFYPDIPGLYRFDLIVFDGGLYSSPSTTIVNVTESFLPRGITPDLRFLWDYLSDFWRLVEGKERIEVFWGAMAQVAAAELLNLWQIDYNKSLRDIQRTIQRKWLHYDLAIYEDKFQLESTTARAVFGGLTSVSIPAAGTSEPAGKILVLAIPGEDLPVQISFAGSGPFTAQQIAARINAFVTPIDSRLVARVLSSRDATTATVRIDAPYALQIGTQSTTTLFSGTNTVPFGFAGLAVAPRVYRVEKNISNLTAVGGSPIVGSDDYLIVGAEAYRIARIIDDPADPEYYQRITLLDDLPTAASQTWYIAGKATSPDLDFYTALASLGDAAIFELIDQETNGTAFAQVPVLGSSASQPGALFVDLSLLGQYLAEPDRYNVFFFKFTRRKYLPISSTIVDVPYLQEKVKVTDTEAVLRRNVDFFLETYRGQSCIRFMTDVDPTRDVWEGQAPPDRLWAEISYLDNRQTIEDNFGIPAEFTLDDLSQLPSSVDYLSAVRGLWYAYFNGPTIFNLRAGAQILLGLPFAEEAGTIEEIRSDFGATTGRILVRDSANTEIVRSYTYPSAINIAQNSSTKAPYVVGDTVPQFAPLVEGVEVLDYVNSPKWFEGYIGQGAFFEVEKFFKFLVRVNSEAFNLSALLFVQSFLRRIKPTYTFPLFVVQVEGASTTVDVEDDTPTKAGVLNLIDGPQFSDNPAGMWDHPKPSGGGYWGSYDEENPGNPAVYPDATYPAGFGFDQQGILPKYGIAATMTQSFAGGDVAFDGLFSYDVGPGASNFGIVSDHFVKVIGPIASEPLIVGPVASTGTGTVSFIYLEILGAEPANLTYQVKAFKNGLQVGASTFSKGATSRDYFAVPISFSVSTGDLLDVRIGTLSGVNTVYWHDLIAVFVTGTLWTLDVGYPAGTYTKFRSL